MHFIPIARSFSFHNYTWQDTDDCAGICLRFIIKVIATTHESSYLMPTTWQNKYSGFLYYHILPHLLTPTIIITAEANDDYTVDILCLVDHLLKCSTHRFPILFMKHC